jgi:hypothetical protein
MELADLTLRRGKLSDEFTKPSYHHLQRIASVYSLVKIARMTKLDHLLNFFGNPHLDPIACSKVSGEYIGMSGMIQRDGRIVRLNYYC